MPLLGPGQRQLGVETRGGVEPGVLNETAMFAHPLVVIFWRTRYIGGNATSFAALASGVTGGIGSSDRRNQNHASSGAGFRIRRPPHGLRSLGV